MSIEYNNWYLNAAKHSYSTVLVGDNATAGTVNCTACHTTHDTVPSCDNSGCHLDNNALGTKRDVPGSHATVPGNIDTDRLPCARSNCHGGGGHDPRPAGCHFSGGGCGPSTNAHPKHVDPTYNTFDCTECHYDNSLGYNGGNGTFGGSLHFNGVKNVAFDNTSNGAVSFGGVLTGSNQPTYAGSGGTCAKTYCHSNGNNITAAGPGVNFTTYVSPAWSGGSIKCGDCHGVPNYNNGTAWRELTNGTTKNTPTHLKHNRNYGGIYTSRYLFWVDYEGNASDKTPPYGWTDAIYDPGEAIIQDKNDNRMLDYGVLNGGNNQAASPPQSPDNVYVNGTADLTDFGAGDSLRFYDSVNTNGNWDPQEDIYWEAGGGGARPTRYDDGNDFLLYIGTTQDVADTDPTVALDSTDQVMYLDSDHDDVYDWWWSSGMSVMAGVEEPIIYTSTSKATGDDLDSADEVLEGVSSIRWWYTDFNRWYSFDCSECHFNNPATQGYGTFRTPKHVNMVKDIVFDYTANGTASKNGTYATQVNDTGAWNATTMECYGIWCHSDAYERDDLDHAPADLGNGFPDWSGTGIFDDSGPVNNSHTIKPQWNDTSRQTVFCGSCHYSFDKPQYVTNSVDRPNTGGHRQGQHEGASQFGWHGNNDAVPCMECHWRYDTYNTAVENQWWRPYGSDKHVDGWLWAYQGVPEILGQFGPLAESQGYSSTCHNTWPGNWRSGYGNSC
jgi:predicted CxxxxCH...CXXCH cytochrome family protein